MIASIFAALTGMFSALGPLLAPLGGGISTLFSYFVNLFVQRKAAEAQAATDMQNAIDQHSGDGAISSAEGDSAQAQLDKIKEEQMALSQAQGQITKGN